MPLYAFPIAATATIIAVSALGLCLTAIDNLTNDEGSLLLSPLGGIGFYLMLSFIYSWIGLAVAFPFALIARHYGFIGLLATPILYLTCAIPISLFKFLATWAQEDLNLAPFYTTLAFLVLLLIFAVPFWFILYRFWPQAFEPTKGAETS